MPNLSNFLSPKRSVIARILASDEKEIELRSLSEKERAELPFLFERGLIVFTKIDFDGSIPFAFSYDDISYTVRLKASSRITVTDVGKIFIFENML